MAALAQSNLVARARSQTLCASTRSSRVVAIATPRNSSSSAMSARVPLASAKQVLRGLGLRRTALVSRRPSSIPAGRRLQVNAVFERFTERAIKAVMLAQQEAKGFSAPEVGTQQLLLGLVAEDRSDNGFLGSGLTLENARAAAMKLKKDKKRPAGAEVPFSIGAKGVFEEALNISRQLSDNFIAPEHLILALLSVDDGEASVVLRHLEVDAEKLRKEALKRLQADKGNTAKGSASPAKSKKGDEKKSALAEFCTDLTARAREGKIDPVIGRDKEVKRVAQILARRMKNNAILLGEPGVGKTAIAEGLARKIAAGKCPDFLVGKRLLSVDMALILAGAKERGELESRVNRLINETIEAEDVILMIDEVHTLVGSGAIGRGNSGSSLDIAHLLKPALARGVLQVIAATTLDEYRKNIEKDAALARRFQPVNVDEPSEEDALLILKGLRERYERHHRCSITDEALSAAVTLSARFIADRYLPDKAIDLMDEAGSRARIAAYRAKKERINQAEETESRDLWKELRQVSARKSKGDDPLEEDDDTFFQIPEVTASSIEEVASSWTGIPLQKVTADDAATLMNLESNIHDRVIGQEDAVAAVARAMHRARCGLQDPERPIASMLFAGPTGVGKTELCKSLANEIFGSESAMVRLDMSEYMERHTVSKMIGSPPGYIGYGEGGTLTEAIRRRPYTLLLLDEIEKAHPDVFNILLQMFEDGRLSDSQGRVVSFKNTLIIMTSNIGSHVIAKGGGSLGFDVESEDSDHKRISNLVKEELKAYFRPELLNRLDEIVVFKQLESENIVEIAEILLSEAANRLVEREMDLYLSDSLMERLLVDGYDKAYGARPLRRAVTALIEDPLSEAILQGHVEDGQAALVDLDSEGNPMVKGFAKGSKVEGRLCKPSGDPVDSETDVQEVDLVTE